MIERDKGWIRLTWGVGPTREEQNTYVVLVPVEVSLEQAVKEAHERLVGSMASDHMIELAIQARA
jgi:hypothetical protein